MISVAERVSNGSAWLDEHFPGWWKSIDLGNLKMASCHECVLGQVYTGHIPVGEQDQLLAQVLERMARVSRFEARTFAESVQNNVAGGFNVLHELFALGREERAARMGFSILWSELTGRTVGSQYEALADEWTKVIISRRLAAHRAELVGVS